MPIMFVNLKAPEKGIQVMAQISKLIYKFVENKEGWLRLNLLQKAYLDLMSR